MASITQTMRFRLSLIRCSEKFGVSYAAKRYQTNRQYICRWKNRFDGSIECVQTDNGPEFTNQFTARNEKSALFQLRLQKHGIRHKLIRPYTPRRNGKVERSHRRDSEMFYATPMLTKGESLYYYI